MDRKRIEELVDFHDINAVILGDVMLDKYLSGDIHRISPEAPVPVVDLQSSDVRLGGAANVALNVSSLGAKTTLIGLVGDDNNGVLLNKLLQDSKNIKGQLITDHQRKTTSKTRIISQNQQLIRIDDEDLHETSNKVVDHVIAKLNELHGEQKIDVLIMQDYNKGFFSPFMILELIKWARVNKIVTCVDPKKNNVALYKGVNLFKPNQKEFYQILNKDADTSIDQLEHDANKLMEIQRCQFLLLTLGSNGVFVCQGKESKLVPTKAKSIVDVSGAGDTVISLAALLYAKRNATFLELGQLSNFAGAAVCNVPGVGVINKEMIIQFANSN
jgi:rfaE bifunctional protein kinase chain/domain